MNKIVNFTKRDLEKLQEGERLIHDVLPIIDKAEECGNDCEEFRTAAQELQRRFAAFKKNFMSPPPTR